MKALMIAIVGLAMVAVGTMASEWEWGLRIHSGDEVDERALADIDSLSFFQIHHPGACCYEDGSCLTKTAEDCEGDWLGVGTSCKPNPCPPPVRVCCLPGDYCLLMTEEHCEAANGTWHFHLTSCDPNPCPVYPGMIWIPAGYVRLGQTGIAEPVHDVWVDGFWIGKYEVTNAEYKEFIDAGGYGTEGYWNPVGWAWRVNNNITLPDNWNSNEYQGGGIPGNEHFPVNGISWWEADAYCRWAGGRLPTEAEWEKAAKGPAPDTPTYPWGEEISGQRANYWNSGDPYDNNTTPVGFYDGRNYQGFQTIDSPSPYGLYDIAGNVWEWCSTKYASYPYDPDDGREDPPLMYNECCRLLRGGSWYHGTSRLRCAERNGNIPNLPDRRDCGVRLARD